ncbi:MAG TPA: hypothetical protein VMD08_09165 [Candidatus Baltobacteraceae bacterium]|nr:hypothetical protein [Candidatus Baltobacteraceae bacterium]
MWRWLSIAVFGFWLVAGGLSVDSGAARAGEPVQASVALLSVPESGGWAEAQLVLKTGDRAWRGSVELAGGTAKLHIQLALGPRTQRFLVVPWWVAPGAGAPRVWVDGVTVDTVIVPPRSQSRPRVLTSTAKASATAASPALVESEWTQAPLSSWPETWRAYDGFDLVLLPESLGRELRPEQESALERWIRWGGAAAMIRPDAPEGVRPLGRGAVFVAHNLEALRKAQAAWTQRGAGAHLSESLLMVWERARPSNQRTTWEARRPGRVLAATVAVYVVCLVAVAAALALRPSCHRFGVHALMVLIPAVILATGITVYGGGASHIEAEEVTLLRDQGTGEGVHACALFRVRADRRATLQFAPVLRQAALYEAETSKDRPSPHRAIRWNVDGEAWERAFVAGETAVIRADGLGPDLGIRVTPAGNRAWQIENRGASTLRAAGLLFPSGEFRAVADVPAGARLHLAAGPQSQSEPGPLSLLPAFWAALLPSSVLDAPGDPVFIASLDPPVRSMRLLHGELHGTATTYVAVSLPPGPAS